MEKRNIIDHVRNVSTIFSKRISRLRNMSVLGMRSIGLIGAAEFVKPGTKRKIDVAHKFAATVKKFMKLA